MKINKEEEFNPEYLLVPRLAMQLPSADRMVFGAIYMFCQLSKKRCIASNVCIGKIADVSNGGVANSLNRLEEIGLIKRFYKDERKKNRDYIISLWGFGKLDSSNQATSIHPQMIRDSSTDEQIKNKIKNNDIADAPKEFIESETFNSKEEIQHWVNSSQSWLQIIGLFAKFKDIHEKLQTKRQLALLIPKYRKVATELAEFNGTQLREAFQKCDEMKDRQGVKIDWTLFTVKSILLK